MPRSDREYLLRYVDQAISHIDKAGLQLTAALQLMKSSLQITDEQLKDDAYLCGDISDQAALYNRVLLMGIRDVIPEIGDLLAIVTEIRSNI